MICIRLVDAFLLYLLPSVYIFIKDTYFLSFHFYKHRNTGWAGYRYRGIPATLRCQRSLTVAFPAWIKTMHFSPVTPHLQPTAITIETSQYDIPTVSQYGTIDSLACSLLLLVLTLEVKRPQNDCPLQRLPYLETENSGTGSQTQSVSLDLVGRSYRQRIKPVISK